jgi:hypothetical protein
LIRRKDASPIRVGTGDVERLLAFLQTQVQQDNASLKNSHERRFNGACWCV